MISTQYINLNMVPSGVMPVLHCSQYDVGRPLGVVIYNGSESVDLSGYTVTIEGTRTDRTPVTAGVTTDGNIGVFTTTPTMTNENDTYRAKVVLTDNAGRVSSLAFVMCVDEKTMDENAEEIEEDASLYQQYTGTVQTIIAQIRGDLAAEITARQNAISAEASARQAADNTLQSNINAEASTRATQDASLQSQINQLIAPSGSAPSAAEVENARIGSDGTVYPTLGEAIRANDSQLKSQLEKSGNISYNLKGGSGESWSTVEFFPKQKKYECIIKAFTVRSTLTDGYIVAQVYKYASSSDSTGVRLFVKTKANYVSQDESLIIDNRDGSVYKVVVSLRPENNTIAQVICLADTYTKTLVHDVTNLDKDGLRRFSAFDFTHGDFSVEAIKPFHNYYYRLVTLRPLQYNRDLNLIIASGWRLYLIWVNDDDTLSAQGWKTGTYTIPSGKKFWAVFARTVDNTSEVLDIDTVLENITFNSVDDDLNDDIENISDDVTEIKPYLISTTASLDFSSFALNATYVGLGFSARLKRGETYTIDILTDDSSDQNVGYFNIYGSDRSNRLNPSAVAAGSGTRSFQFTNTYSEDIEYLNFVIVKLFEHNTYSITITAEKNLPKVVELIEQQIQAITDGTGSVPEYYIDHLNTAIANARTNMLSCGINGESFVFISDVHWVSNTKNSPALIKHIVSKLPIENVVYGGDTINGDTYDGAVADMADFGSRMNYASPTLLSLYGNHDGNALDGGTPFTHNEFYTLVQKYADDVMVWGGADYFYRDNPTTKTRYICLDSGSGNGKSVEAQTAWLNNVLANTASGWHILVFVHVVYMTTTDITNNTITSFMQSINTILDAYNADGTKGKVEAIFGGHTHIDANKSTPGGIPIILIDCDVRTQSESGNPHDAGTIGEQAFDIVTVNYTAETIYCTRVGRGSSRTISY